MTPRDRLQQISRYTACTTGVIEACVQAVAAETGLEDAVPGFTAHEVALIAQNALEAAEAGDVEAHEGAGSDHLLGLVADARSRAALVYEKQKMITTAETARKWSRTVVEQIAASSDRSPIIWYEDIYSEAAQSLVRRGDSLGLTRQVECIADVLANPGEEANPIAQIRELAIFYMQLGDLPRGLRLLARLLRSDPSNAWTFNVMAIRLPSFGLRSLGRLAVARGLELVRRQDDPDDLVREFNSLLKEIGTEEDRSDAPADAIEDLRDALHRADFDAAVSLSPRDLALRLVPEVKGARVKELPPLPTPEALAVTAAGLRAVLASAPKNTPSPLAVIRDAFRRVAEALARDAPGAPIPTLPDPLADATVTQVTSTSPKVGRNDPCPCASGKKFKKCCLGSTAAPGR